jgi:hypothetical protein
LQSGNQEGALTDHESSSPNVVKIAWRKAEKSAPAVESSSHVFQGRRIALDSRPKTDRLRGFTTEFQFV